MLTLVIQGSQQVSADVIQEVLRRSYRPCLLYSTPNRNKMRFLFLCLKELVHSMLNKAQLIYLSFYFMTACLHVCMRTSCVPCALRSQKRVLDPLGLELQKVSHHRVLRTEPGSSIRTAGVLGAVPPAQYCYFLVFAQKALRTNKAHQQISKNIFNVCSVLLHVCVFMCILV